MLVSTPRATPLFVPLTPVPIDQRISCQNPGHRFLNMLYKAHYIAKHESALRSLILPWHIKRFYTPLHAPRNHYFWLDLSIRQTFPCQNFVRAKFAKLYPCQTFPLCGITIRQILQTFVIYGSRYTKFYMCLCSNYGFFTGAC